MNKDYYKIILTQKLVASRHNFFPISDVKPIFEIENRDTILKLTDMLVKNQILDSERTHKSYSMMKKKS